MLIIVYGLSCVLTSLAFVGLPPQEIDGFVGYYGLGDGISTLVRLTEDFDLQTAIAEAQAHGYNATYRPARAREGMRYTGLPNSSRVHSGVNAAVFRYIGITYYVGVNETFDYAVPRFASIDCPYKVSDEWVKLRLQEFFPQLTEDESSDFAEQLTSGYASINVTGSPIWEKISGRLGPLSYVDCVLPGSVDAHYAEGMIEYMVPSVTISKEITLMWDRPVFIISANIRGFVSVRVDSKYMLKENWIKRVFARMFANIGLPAEGIKRYSIYKNWLVQVD